MGGVRTSIFGRPRPYPTTDAPGLPTLSFATIPFVLDRRQRGRLSVDVEVASATGVMQDGIDPVAPRLMLWISCIGHRAGDLEGRSLT